MSPIATVIVTIVILAIVIAIIVYLMNWLYRRSSKEVAFVRTGLGGQKVVMNGGAFVLPIIHEVIPVNMNTLRLEVQRGRERALITKNRMRVDVVAEFYLRVQSTPDAIANAAQTLGQRTMHPEALSELMEGKFVDALRSVAAEMSMEEMHEKRGEYVKRVKQAAAEDLLKNGLELETVSLTGLDQTNMEFFNPSNAFDAEGLTQLTEQIERRKKIRNDIEQDTMIEIRNKNLEAEKQSLIIDQASEAARLEHERTLEMRRAGQRAEVWRASAPSRSSRPSRPRSPPAMRSSARASRPTSSCRATASIRSRRSSAWRSSGARPWSWPSSSAPSPSPRPRNPNPRPRPRRRSPGPRPCRRRRRCSAPGRPRWPSGARRSS